MTRDKLNQFMKELTELCYKHKLWVEGDNLRVEDSDCIIVGTDMAFDWEGQSLTATFDDHGSRL
jgi:hypothetical protein